MKLHKTRDKAEFGGWRNAAPEDGVPILCYNISAGCWADPLAYRFIEAPTRAAASTVFVRISQDIELDGRRAGARRLIA